MAKNAIVSIKQEVIFLNQIRIQESGHFYEHCLESMSHLIMFECYYPLTNKINPQKLWFYILYTFSLSFANMMIVVKCHKSVANTTTTTTANNI